MLVFLWSNRSLQMQSTPTNSGEHGARLAVLPGMHHHAVGTLACILLLIIGRSFIRLQVHQCAQRAIALL